MSKPRFDRKDIIMAYCVYYGDMDCTLGLDKYLRCCELCVMVNVYEPEHAKDLSHNGRKIYKRLGKKQHAS